MRFNCFLVSPQTGNCLVKGKRIKDSTTSVVGQQANKLISLLLVVIYRKVSGVVVAGESGEPFPVEVLEIPSL